MLDALWPISRTRRPSYDRSLPAPARHPFGCRAEDLQLRHLPAGGERLNAQDYRSIPQLCVGTERFCDDDSGLRAMTPDEVRAKVVELQNPLDYLDGITF
jgi:hypothetical protein